MNQPPPAPVTEIPPGAAASFPRALLVQGALALGLFILAVLLPPVHLFDDQGHYLVLHLTLEFLSIATALMIFTVGWFSFGHEHEARFQILACAFLCVALLDFLHVLSYTGMPALVTPSSLEKALNFWLPARLISALALLAAAALPQQTVLSARRRRLALAATLALIGVLAILGLFYPDTAPHTFIPGQGLTPFKITIEYTAMALYGTTLFFLIRGWRRDHDRFRALLIAGLWVLLLGELSLTIYATVTDLFNLLGHVCKVWGDGFIFWAVYTQALDEPHQRLRQSQQLLARHEAQTQALLREHQALLDNAFVGIVFVREHRIIRANRGAEALFGYPPGTLNGVSSELIYPDHAAYLELGERAYPVIRRGEVFAAEVELARRDGSRFWCLMRGQALAASEPLPGAIWILENATERRQARQALEEAAGLYRAIIESRHVIKVLIDPDDGHIVDANQAAAEFYGYPREVLQQRYAWDQNASISREALLALFADVKAGRADLTVEREFVHRRAGGELREVAIHLDLIHRENHALLLATVLDLTARKSAEAALRASEERYRSALAALAEGVTVYDRQGALITANPAAGRILGISTDEIRERPLDAGDWRIIRADGTAFAHDQWPAVVTLSTGIPQREVPMGVFKPDGSLTWILVNSEPIRDTLTGALQAVVVSFNDITARKAAEDALRTSLAEVERHDAWMVELNRMNELLLSCETRAEAYTVIAQAAGRLFAGCTGALAMLGEEAAPDLQVVAAWGDPVVLPARFPLNDCWALRRGEIHQAADPHRGAQCRHFRRPPSSGYICVPLTVRGETLGLLHLDACAQPSQAGLADLHTLIIAVSEAVKLTLSNIRLQESLREQAVRDPLTGLFNRRFLDETLPRELHLSRRRGEPLAVAMLDLDHFKRINDAYGHEAGDAALRAIGTLLTGSMRAGDLACRYGGEELTLILPGATLDAARKRLDGLRQAIMETHLVHQGGDLPPLTVSIGVAAAAGPEQDAADLLARADAALYQAKKAGRNRVVAAAP